MRLSSDLPIGSPPFELSEDEIATVIDLLCRGSEAACSFATAGMFEVPITIHVRKAMRHLKKELGLTNLQVSGEVELLDINTQDPEILGRIDIVLQFLHQFGNEDDYLAVECKRVGAGENKLNQKYVTQGVDRFVTGKYSTDHHWGMMLGYVLKLPVDEIVSGIDARIRNTYGETAKLEPMANHPQSLALHTGLLSQGNTGHIIRLVHIFVDMTPAAPMLTTCSPVSP